MSKRYDRLDRLKLVRYRPRKRGKAISFFNKISECYEPPANQIASGQLLVAAARPSDLAVNFQIGARFWFAGFRVVDLDSHLFGNPFVFDSLARNYFKAFL
jgi:hypothetical protein